MHPCGFSKQDRLCSQKLIDNLFLSGNKLMVFPYSIRWMVSEQNQVLISAPKRKFHHAVDRNRVKRLTRECYRLHKPQLYTILDQHNIHLAIAITYIHTEILDFQVLQHRFDKILQQLNAQLPQQ